MSAAGRRPRLPCSAKSIAVLPSCPPTSSCSPTRSARRCKRGARLPAHILQPGRVRRPLDTDSPFACLARTGGPSYAVRLPTPAIPQAPRAGGFGATRTGSLLTQRSGNGRTAHGRVAHPPASSSHPRFVQEGRREPRASVSRPQPQRRGTALCRVPLCQTYRRPSLARPSATQGRHPSAGIAR